MKIELVKQTTAVTGAVYYYTSVDGYMQTGSWSSDYQKAIDKYNEIIEMAKKFPETVKEIVETIEI